MKEIAVFGYNRLSFEAISRIDTDAHQIRVFDHNPAQVDLACDNGFSASTLDFRNDEDLKTIGIGSSVNTLLCCFEDDSENVFLTLSARALDKELQIIAIIDSPDAAEKLIAAGANKIIDPYQICGRKIHDMLKRPEINDLFDHTVFGRNDLHIAEVVVSETSFLRDIFVSQLELNTHYNLILIGIINKQISDQMHFVAEEDDRRLNSGDILVILGPSREIRAFKKDMNDELCKI
ncbi:MAG: NAD-binding protein [Methylomonas sp.]|jgi:voltage-gated potassium channel|uniref:potassium channel family protein n=1 Tax=Methylomonas sp. TaxID=418 RepID=UPI0025D7C1D5|nr:NAD-binding protein [Methylomonas sp.]MCK9609065.1 NAD-binding protein [Methylomonas sp.]